MAESENDLARELLKSVAILVLTVGLNLLLAWPFKWCWNYGVTHAFGLPQIEWGHAFCLLWVLAHLRFLIHGN